MSKANQTTASLDYVALAFDCGQNLGESNKLENQAAAFKAKANNNIKALHIAKVTVGQYRKDGNGCAIATAFIDGCMKAGIAAGTAQKVYLPTFKAAVASGKEVTDWNSQRGKDKKSGGKGKGTAAFSDLLLKAFNHDGGASLQALCEQIQSQYEDASIDSVYAGFADYLESEGFEITQ